MKKTIASMNIVELQNALLSVIASTLDDDKARFLTAYNAYYDSEKSIFGMNEKAEYTDRENAMVNVVNQNTGEIRQFRVGDKSTEYILSRFRYIYGLFGDEERASHTFSFELVDGDGKCLMTTSSVEVFRAFIRKIDRSGKA